MCGKGFSIRRVSQYSYETCASCHGVWMSRSTLIGMAFDIDPSAPFEMRQANIDEPKRACPDCRLPMNKAWVSRVPLDYCEVEEHGIWFDGGELRQVLERVGETEPPTAELPTNFRSLLGDFFSPS